VHRIQQMPPPALRNADQTMQSILAVPAKEHAA
jgi:hypothetical protein